MSAPTFCAFNLGLNALISAVMFSAIWLGFHGFALVVEPYAGLSLQSIETVGNQRIELAIWYPTTVVSSKQDLRAYSLDVSLGARSIPGKRPLIVISHGTGGNLMNHHELAAALARAGFIAVALNHPGDYYKDKSTRGKAEYFFERPRQVSRVLNALLT